jgi:hypothetical protein
MRISIPNWLLIGVRYYPAAKPGTLPWCIAVCHVHGNAFMCTKRKKLSR